MKLSTIIKSILVGIALYCIWWVWNQWTIQRDMIERGQEIGRVCEPPGKPVIANGIEWGCVGDAYVSYQQTMWLPTDPEESR